MSVLVHVVMRVLCEGLDVDKHRIIEMACIITDGDLRIIEEVLVNTTPPVLATHGLRGVCVCVCVCVCICACVCVSGS